ncbi:MAG: DUF535 family protein [Gammaproteobacteria bacterium]|nr:DUF535 family protein [Gammaproteobacteria bacterium]
MNVSKIAALNYPNSARRRIKFFLRVLLNGKKCLQKIEDIFSHPKLNQIIIDNPSQYTKIFFPYLYRGLKINDRISSIRNHYQFIRKYWNKKLTNAVYHKKQMHLAEISFDQDARFYIALEQTGGTRYENESEILISLFAQEKIISVGFNFTVNENGDSGIFISTMQGSSRKDFHELNHIIKDFTKKTGGMRPQMFLIFALTVIASSYNLKEILALKMNSHIKRKRIKANMDAFWDDFGGKPANENFYAMPLTYERKLIEDVKTNKRAMYKHRYKVLDNVEQQIRLALAAQ